MINNLSGPSFGTNLLNPREMTIKPHAEEKMSKRNYTKHEVEKRITKGDAYLNKKFSGKYKTRIMVLDNIEPLNKIDENDMIAVLDLYKPLHMVKRGDASTKPTLVTVIRPESDRWSFMKNGTLRETTNNKRNIFYPQIPEQN